MAIKKKKISEMTLADNLEGLYTIGVKVLNGVQTSVKVSLEFIQTVYNDVVKATQDAKTATKKADDAADRLNDLSDHRDEVRDDGYWYHWNEETGQYEKGVLARGNVMYATFDIDPTDMVLSMYTDPEYTGANFFIDENGVLIVEI